MSAREQILESIRAHLPVSDAGFELHEDGVLADLGLTSLHLITVVLAFQDEYGVRLEQLADGELPRTVGDLISFVERGSGRAS